MFRKIHIVLSSPEKLQHDVEKWVELLVANDGYKYVVRLEIEGCLRLALSDRDERMYLPWLKDYDETDVFGRVPYHVSGYNDTWIDPTARRAAHGEDQVWEPLVSLVRKLPRLVDLIYAALNLFPPPLLETMHMGHSECRLHMPLFRLCSLAPEREVDPYELKLASSPCLHSVSLHYKKDSLYEDRQLLAVMQMASGLAPNLKKVYSVISPASGELRDPDREDAPRWKGFASYSSLDRGSLLSLNITGHARSTPEKLTAWKQYSDLSKLTGLKLSYGIGLQSIDLLAPCAELRSLTTLELDIDAYAFRGGWTESAQDAVRSFIRSVPPLRALKVCAKFGLSLLDAIVEQHGHTLVRLWLRHSQEDTEESAPTATSSQLRRIVQGCPELEDLTLAVLRTQGDPVEVENYRLLGRHPRLQRLALTLDCIDPMSNSDDDDGSTSQIASYDSSVTDTTREQRAFIKSAVDRDLAASIFRLIATSKPPNACQLQTLTVDVAGDAVGLGVGLGWHDSDVDDILKIIGRSWLCQPHPRDDMKGEVIVTEIDQAGREKAEDCMGSELWRFKSSLREVWPSGADDDWRRDWHSFPLQIAADSVCDWVTIQQESG